MWFVVCLGFDFGVALCLGGCLIVFVMVLHWLVCATLCGCFGVGVGGELFVL